MLNELNELRNYYRKHMKKSEFKKMAKLLDDYNDFKMILFLIYSYNCYALLHSNEVYLSLITNPEALTMRIEEEKTFILELKEYIEHIVFTQPIKEDIQNGRIDNN